MITIWHNPRCSKSREMLALLKERGLAVTERRYLDDAPTAEELTRARDALGCRAIDMIRRKEPLFRELGLTGQEDEATLITAMADNPRLIERPIVFTETAAAIGRPVEAVLAIL